MNKSTKFIGIDISKKVFDVWSDDFGHRQFRNTHEGFLNFSMFLVNTSWCVMEYTGSYYQQLAMYLYENEVAVSIINPLVIKRFIQMKLQHNKTDKSDAKMIVNTHRSRVCPGGIQALNILTSARIYIQQLPFI